MQIHINSDEAIKTIEKSLPGTFSYMHLNNAQSSPTLM